MSDFKFKMVRYKAETFPILEEESSDYFYIIKEGQVRQITSLPYLKQKESLLGVGDFFGVISAMARRPHFHSVEVLEDTLAIMIRWDEFDHLIQANSPIAMKILRYFSHQLRLYNSLLAKLSIKAETFEDVNRLYDLALYYTNVKLNIGQAAYALLKYIKYCPNGTNVAQAKTKWSDLMSKHKDKIKLEPQKIDNFHFSYADQQVIFLEHEPGDCLYIITRGEVKIAKFSNNQFVLLNILKPGDIFGEMAILENKPRNATAIASGEVVVMQVSRENFPSVVANHSQVATKIIQHLSERIWLIQRHIINMTIGDISTRLYDALLMQVTKDRVQIADKREYGFNLTFSDLLQYSGLDNADGAHALQQILKNDKNIEVQQNKIYCKNLAVLYKQSVAMKRMAEIRQAGQDSQTS